MKTTGNKVLDYVIIGALVILVLQLLKRLLNLINLVTPDERPTTSDPAEDPFPVDPNNLTYPASQYIGWADQLEELLFKGFTEDEDAIKGIFYELRTDSDFAALVNAFGVRRGFYIFDTYNLFTAVAAYLSNQDRDDINQHNANFAIKYRV